jgi:hypothetical protein
MIEHSRTHSNQRAILHFASMKGDTMPDGNVVTKDARRLAVERMDARVILNVCSVSYLYEMNISTNDSIEPDGAVVPHFDVAHYHGTLAKVAMFAESGSGHPLECLYDCHIVSPLPTSPFG